jgi:hypothetical protein
MIVEHPVTAVDFKVNTATGKHKAYKALELLTLLKLPTDELMAAVSAEEIELIYNNALDKYRNSASTKTFHDYLTPKKLRKLIESLINDSAGYDSNREAAMVRIFYGDPYTGEDWCEENDVVGFVGRSSGILKVPLLIPRNCISGPSILESSIVKIIKIATGEILWKSSNYITPELIIVPSKRKSDGFTYDVNRIKAGQEESLASFDSYGLAASYVAFITGAIYSYMHTLTVM